MTSAKDRIRQQTDARLVRIQQRSAINQAVTSPTIYAGDGQVSQLGQNAVPVRGQGAQSYSIGEPVAIAQGILGGLGAAESDQDFLTQLQELTFQVQRIATRRGIQLFTGDPNDEDNNGENRAFQLFDQQLLYTGSETDSGGLYYHQIATDTQEDKWVPVAMVEDISWVIPVPEQGKVYAPLPRAKYRTQVTSIFLYVNGASTEVETDGANSVTVGSTTITISTPIGSNINAGDRFTVTATATDETELEFVIGTLRF